MLLSLSTTTPYLPRIETNVDTTQLASSLRMLPTHANAILTLLLHTSLDWLVSGLFITYYYYLTCMSLVCVYECAVVYVLVGSTTRHGLRKSSVCTDSDDSIEGKVSDLDERVN